MAVAIVDVGDTINSKLQGDRVITRDHLVEVLGDLTSGDRAGWHLNIKVLLKDRNLESTTSVAELTLDLERDGEEASLQVHS